MYVSYCIFELLNVIRVAAIQIEINDEYFMQKKVLKDFTLCFRFEIVLKYVFFVFQDGTESRNIRISAESAFMLP